MTRQTLIDIHRRHLGAQGRDAAREVAIESWRFPVATSVSLASVLAGDLTSPSQAAMRDERAARLHQALEQMDEVDREVLALRHFEDLSNQEVAEALGISQKAASMRYVRALERLKQAMKDEG
jgi:RNA polymerase sigma-70 factor (ECF subfamily)